MFKSEQLAARRSSTLWDLMFRIWNFLGIWFLGFGIFTFGISSQCVGDEPARPAPEAIMAKFAKLDRNGDQRLSVDEFKVSGGHLRDFDLFDRDADDFLSLAEYWSLPTHPLDQRGPLPDPLTAVVDQFVGILDQLFNNWDKEPTRTLPVNEFLGGFSKKIGRAHV